MVASKIGKMTVKAARAQQRLSQEAMAQRLEVTKKTYNDWENGNIRLKAYHMFALAGVLGMEIDELDFP